MTMAITKKECAWPECDNKFYGTERKEYCGNTCKNKAWRKTNKQNELIVTKIDELESK